jgi:hypothetical protein
MKVSDFDEIEKAEHVEKDGSTHDAIYVRRGGNTIKRIVYTTKKERDSDYKKVNDVLMKIRDAYISRIAGDDGKEKKNTKT